MLLPKFTVADLIAYTYGRCYCHISVVDVITTCNCYLLFSMVADVIAFMCVEDGKNTCYLQIILADVVAMVADGITTQGG